MSIVVKLNVFDDVIDHSYDLIEDPQERLECIMDTLRKICGRPWAYYHHLREDMLDRFYDNYKMMERYIDLSFETISLALYSESTFDESVITFLRFLRFTPP